MSASLHPVSAEPGETTGLCPCCGGLTDTQESLCGACRASLRGVSYASDIIEDYFRQTGQPGDSALDAAFMFERSVLRDMLSRLEVILRDEGIDHALIGRVIRHVLYGSPSPAVAELRMQERQRTLELAATATPSAVAARALREGDWTGFAGVPEKP